MAYNQTTTLCMVHLIPLHTLSRSQAALCETLRRKAGRCWSDLVAFHLAERTEGNWVGVRELEQRVAGQFPFYLTYKARLVGVAIRQLPKDYSGLLDAHL